jgi:hypothetical protein
VFFDADIGQLAFPLADQRNLRKISSSHAILSALTRFATFIG